MSALKHGHCSGGHSITYTSWRMMVQRCTNFNREDFQQYYKDVDVDPAWLDFTNFLADMGERPSLEESIGRVDGRLGYCKENCEWQTRVQQAACHFDRTKTIGEETLTFGEWAERCGILRKTLVKRSQRGWGDEAFTVMSGERRRK